MVKFLEVKKLGKGVIPLKRMRGNSKLLFSFKVIVIRMFVGRCLAGLLTSSNDKV